MKTNKFILDGHIAGIQSCDKDEANAFFIKDGIAHYAQMRFDDGAVFTSSGRGSLAVDFVKEHFDAFKNLAISLTGAA